MQYLSKTPPKGLVMPFTPQIIFIVFSNLPWLGFILWSIRDLTVKKSPLLALFLLGGLVCTFFEAIVDVMGMCFFPFEGQIVGLYDFERAIPLFLWGVYSWFVGGQGYIFFKLMDSGTLTKSRLWKAWALTMLSNTVLELPGILMGVYTYYGYQPFNFLGFPLWWALVNSVMPISAGYAIHKLSPHLKGWKMLAIIIILPMADGFANAALAWPIWCALNSDYGFEATYPATIVTAGLSSFTVWAISTGLPTEDFSKGDIRRSDSEHEPLIQSR